MIDSCDSVRTSGNVRDSDPRTQHHSLEQRIGYIDQFTLSANVPDNIRIHFETGRNLYVYAWYVYRFNMVAEQHILASLEMAARLRLASFTADEPPRGLAKLLRAASANGFIANSRLSDGIARAFELARERHRLAEMNRMNEEGMSGCHIDYTYVQPTEDELQFDWIGRFITTLPHLRNMHAHGTDNLRPNVGRTFDIVCELINQLFENVEIQE